jgi:hypothetical protein
MRVIKVITTAYSEENFFLLTNLTDEQISEVIQPIVNSERDGYGEYDNEFLCNELLSRFPNNHIEMIIDFDELTF